MRDYYLQLNSPAAGPVVLYYVLNDANWPDQWRIAECWEALEANATAPLEKFLLQVTAPTRTGLLAKIKSLRKKKEIPAQYLKAFEQAVNDCNYFFMQDMISEGVADAANLHRDLERYKYLLEDVMADHELLTRALFFGDELPTVELLQQKISQEASGKELVELINKNDLVKEFAPHLSQLPANYSEARIKKIIAEKFPGKLAFTKFFNTVITEAVTEIDRRERILGAAEFHEPETYRQFPGNNAVSCSLDTSALPVIDLKGNFSRRNLERTLVKYPNGFIVSPTEEYNERVVLPSARRRNLEIGAEFFSQGPETANISAIYQNKPPEAKATFFIELFEDYLKAQIDTSSSPIAQRFIWILISLESLREILGAFPGGELPDKALAQKLKTITVFLDRQAQKVPKKIRGAETRRRLEFLRQQNIAKCLKLTEALSGELRAAQQSPRNISPAAAQIAELGSLMAKQGLIIEAQENYSEVHPAAVKAR